MSEFQAFIKKVKLFPFKLLNFYLKPFWQSAWPKARFIAKRVFLLAGIAGQALSRFLCTIGNILLKLLHATGRLLASFFEAIGFIVTYPFSLLFRAVRSLAKAILFRALEVFTFVSWCTGWFLVTWGIVRLTGIVEIWLISAGVLLMGFAGWRFMLNILVNGFYFLSQEEEKGK